MSDSRQSGTLQTSLCGQTFRINEEWIRRKRVSHDRRRKYTEITFAQAERSRAGYVRLPHDDAKGVTHKTKGPKDNESRLHAHWFASRQVATDTCKLVRTRLANETHR